MELKYVTCSGANEHTSIGALFALYEQFPFVEFGIQVSGQKCGEGSSRLDWLRSLRAQILAKNINLPLALHINQDWVEAFCQGELSPELQELLSYGNKLGMPMFQRVQLNFKVGREKTPNMDILEKQIISFPKVRFILSYNDANADIIRELYRRNEIVFDCLIDESFGEGIVPQKRLPLLFPDIVQGYAGGLSSENVISELKKINSIVPKDALVFIDAEGKLKGNDGHFSFMKAHDFLLNAATWQK